MSELTAPRFVFAAGGTGYLGRRLIPALLARGHRLRALARPGSEGKLVAAVENPPAGVRVLEVPDIRAAARSVS